MRTGPALAATAAALLLPAAAQAALWGYVDGAGTAHVAPTQLDSRYHLVMGDARDAQRVPGKADGAGGLLTWLEFAPEVKSLQPLLREAAAAHGVNIELLKAIIAVESGFDAKAISPRGAVGLMQLTPASAQHYGGLAGDGAGAARDRLLDPRTNILAGARMLSTLTRRYGRIDVALAAWNAGERAVRKAGGEMPAIAETQAHVHLVLELYWALLQARMPRDIRIHE